MVIQQLLKEANPKLTFTEAKYQPPPDEGEAGKVCRRPTPELYLGSERGSRDHNDGGYKESAAFTYKLPDKIPDEAFALKGKWNAQPEFIRHLSDSSDDFLRLNYEAKAVYLVAGIGGGKPQKLFVSQDEKPLPTKARGVDVKDDTTGRTYVELTKKRMYYIVDNPGFEGHQLDLSPQGAGVELYSFTFGNDCENKFDHK